MEPVKKVDEYKKGKNTEGQPLTILQELLIYDRLIGVTWERNMKSKIYKLLKMFFVAFGVIFLLTACGNDGETPFTNKDQISEDEMAEQQSSSGFIDGSNRCWQGDLLDLFYKPLGEMSLKVYKNITSEDIMHLMILAFSLWMAFQILRHVASPSPESIGEFWTKVLRKATLCFACGYLASSPENIFYVINTFILPIYITLLELCGSILDLMNKTPEATAKSLKIVGNTTEICETYNYNMVGTASCALPDTSAIEIQPQKFPQEPLQLMGCMACAVGSRLDVGYKIALYAMKSGFFGFIVGVFLAAAFLITKLGFALYLVDSIFRLNMMIIIMPFLILFFAFEQTRKWSATGFKIILNSSAIMLCLGILVSMTIFAMQKILINRDMGEFGEIPLYNDFGVVPISLIFLGFIIIKASGLAVSLSDSVTGGGGDTKFQKKMAALVGTVAKGIFTAVTAGGGKVITTIAEHSARVRAIAEKAQKAQKKAQQIQQKMQKLAGRQRKN